MFTSLNQWPCVNSFAGLPGAFYTRLQPQPPEGARLLHANKNLAELLNLHPSVLESEQFLQVVSGQAPLPGGDTLAAVYSGHQFGVWAGQLGDGRAHLLGEVHVPSGTWELQLKGAGRTPYSRMADGRAVLRSSVREYLASEAMAGLGIPTSRALALVVSNEPVYRETVETAAIVTRVAPSFVRFGSFEHWYGQPEQLRTLLGYVIRRFFPECIDGPELSESNFRPSVLCWLTEVVARTARLMAQWQTVGFCHGVMNTDNMSILGLTIDYGPYGFIDGFQANHVCNHSDTSGRYAWNVQPAVAHWNLYRLASVLVDVGLTPDELKACLATYESEFVGAYRQRLTAKFGLLQWEDGDDALIDDWWALLHAQQADFTLAFRRLSGLPEQPGPFLELFAEPRAAHDWLDAWLARVARDNRPVAQRRAAMNAVNPLYVLRNHQAEQAIQAANRGDASEIDTLLTLLADPYTEHPGREAYAAPAPEWASRLHVSCSS